MPERSGWEELWVEQNTPWDLGGVTPALVSWSADRDLEDKRVLVPGCGRGYDAHFMSKRGARVTAVDISEHALESARATHPRSSVDWRWGDVTALDDEPRYDYVWEYTCLCALDRDRLGDYIDSIARVIVPGGRFFGLTFHTVRDPDNGPPFQIEPSELRALLETRLVVDELETDTTRSLKARLGAEMWFVARRP